MNPSTMALVSSLVLMLSVGAGGGPASAAPTGEGDRYRIEGPFTHGSLSIYVVRGKSGDARRFITLDEGLRTNRVALRELGARAGEDRARVNELEIENDSDDWLFLQAGDVIQGGKQDRTIAIDVAIPPRSGPRPIAAFCVEHGRWTSRAAGMAFRGSPAIVGSNALKKSIQEEKSQPRVWEEVARQSSRAAAMVASTGEAPASLSATGTYNAIVENRKIAADRADYVQALLPQIAKRRDAVGIVVAIDGEITAADLYGSASLFEKVSKKLLESYALEATLAPSAKGAPAALSSEAARKFLDEVSRGTLTQDRPVDSVLRTRRSSSSATAFEYEEKDSRTGARTLLHENVVRN